MRRQLTTCLAKLLQGQTIEYDGRELIIRGLLENMEHTMVVQAGKVADKEKEGLFLTGHPFAYPALQKNQRMIVSQISSDYRVKKLRYGFYRLDPFLHKAIASMHCFNMCPMGCEKNYGKYGGCL